MNRPPTRHSGTTSQPLRIAAALVLTLVPALAVLGLVPAASAAPGDTGWIRAAHLAPDTDKAEVQLTPFQGGQDVTLDGVDYSDVTDYVRVPTGLYTIDIRAAGSVPMVSKIVRVTEDAAITVVASGDQGDVTAQAVFDDLRPPPAGQAKLRLISAVPGANVTAQVPGGPLLARDVTTGSATGYATVAAQVWQVSVTAGADPGAGAATRARVPLDAGGIYTLLALQDGNGDLTLQAIEDSSGSSVMPRGGVDTGGGGLADAGDAGSGTAAALAMLLSVGLLGGLRLRPGTGHDGVFG